MIEIDLINKSNNPTEKLLKIIKFARPRGCDLCKLIVKDTIARSNSIVGPAPYSAELHFGGWIEPYIIARFGPSNVFPYHSDSTKTQSKNGYNLTNYHFETKVECITYILSHEFWHLNVLKNPKTRHIMYSTSPKKEVVADAYAIKKLNKYRKLKAEGKAPI